MRSLKALSVQPGASNALGLISGFAAAQASPWDRALASTLRATASAAQVLAGSECAIAAVRTSSSTTLGSLTAQQAGGKPLAEPLIRDTMAAVARDAVVSLPGARDKQSALYHTAATAGVRALAAVRLNVGAFSGCLLVGRRAAYGFPAATIIGLDSLARCATFAARETQAAIRAERGDLARRLHDSLGQTLTSLIFAIDELEEPRRNLDASRRVRALRSHACKAVSRLRVVVDRLAAGREEGGEARPEVRELLRGLSQFGTAVHCTGNFDLRFLPCNVGGCLHDVMREALLNVQRHAGARRVDLQITRSDQDVSLVIVDDGKGFSESNAVRRGWGHFGLHAIRESVAEVGGAFVLETAPGRGTRISVRVPCQEG